MKIELQKETSVDKKSGLPDIWFWVRAYNDTIINSHIRVVSECFREEKEAQTFYDGMITHYNAFNTFESKIEILLSNEPTPPTI